MTGGLGFIGSNFIRYTLDTQENVRVVNVDNLSYGANRANLLLYARSKSYTFVRGDVTDTALMSKLIHDVDAVVNFAAESHVDRSIAGAEMFVRTNIMGVHSILEAMRKAKSKAKFVQIGTDEEYGDVPKGSSSEKDRLNPSSPYAASKAAASMLVHAYHRTYELNTIITRCTNNFGPSQFPEKLIPKAIIRASLGMKVPVYGMGKNTRDWIYVEEHCRAIDKVIHAGRVGEVYNVSSGNELENIGVVSMILEILEKPAGLIEFVEDRPGHDVRYSLDSSKIRTELGWRPQGGFREALVTTVEWYMKNEKWWRPLVDRRVLSPTPWKLRW